MNKEWIPLLDVDSTSTLIMLAYLVYVIDFLKDHLRSFAISIGFRGKTSCIALYIKFVEPRKLKGGIEKAT
jgi:hypothetical protein